jgi:hypothetical protein
VTRATSEPSSLAVLLEEHGRDLYWFVSRLTPGGDARRRESIVEAALRGASMGEVRLPMWPAALQRAFRLIAEVERSGGLRERRSQAASTVAWAALRAWVTGAPTRIDAEAARSRLPLPVLAAVELVRLGFDDPTIAAILGEDGGAGTLRRGRLADALRRSLVWAAQAPRAILSLIGGIRRGGGEPAAVLAIAAAQIGEGEADEASEEAEAVREQLRRLGRSLEASVTGGEKVRLAMVLYNQRELEAVALLRDDLRCPEILPWVYDRDALGDRPIRDEIERVLLRAGAFVVAVGAHGLGDWQGLEISAAMRRAAATSDRASLVVAVLESLRAEMEPATGPLLGVFRRVDLRMPPRSERIGEIQAVILGAKGAEER